MKKHVLIGIMFLSCAGFMGLKVDIDGIERSKAPGSSIIYIPSGKYLKYATLGYSSLAADLIYLWAIQYYGETKITNRFGYLEHIFTVISELDPLYLDPYEIGALIAVYEAENPEMALKILDKGIEKNPEQWIFPFEAGHIAQWTMKNYEIAREYYKKALAIEGVPAQTKRLFANAAFETRDYETAWKTMMAVLQSAQDERTRKIASNHLYRIKSAVDIENLTEALAKYREKYHHFPQDLNLLVSSGFLNAVPLDMDGKAYLYDQETGEVKSPTSPWKR